MSESIVRKFKASGLTQKAFCAKHDISFGRLCYHLYKAKRSKTLVKQSKTTAATPSFITFNAKSTTHQQQSKPSALPLTIIHGRFTTKQLQEYLHTLEG